jgi:predicted ATPase/class 3 adenylate cyclase
MTSLEFNRTAAGDGQPLAHDLEQIDFAAVNPDAYIPGDRRRALATLGQMSDRVVGAALFADISGFTTLTEALAKELGAHRGAELITKSLNEVFHALISVLDRYGGEVIYFSGDAITCWIDGDDGMRATACGLAMQRTMQQLHEVVTPAGIRVALAMKIAVAVGGARRFVVGDPNVQRIDVLAGRLIDQLADAERHAQKGEVVLDQSALAALRGRVETLEIRTDDSTRRSFGVVSRIDDGAFEPVARPAPATLPEAVVKEWLLPVVYERLRARRGEFIAELRPAYPMFLRFAGIDYDSDEDAIPKLDAFIRDVQQIVTSFGGNVLNISLGDKGAYLYAVFGAPIAHEDDAVRAVSASLQLRELPKTTSVTDIQIGITYGRLRSGMYGHQFRQAFTCLGDAVNTAARLMAAAKPGEIYVSDPVRMGAGDRFAWKALQPIKVKGRMEPLPVFALVDASGGASRVPLTHQTALLGRSTELAALRFRFDAAQRGTGQVVGISAEAGIGKSRLLAEFAREARTRGAVVACGECQSYGINRSYFAWRNVWLTLFGIDESSSEHEQVRALEDRLARIDSHLAFRAPLLSSLLDLAIPDNELTSSFDAKLRKASLEDLLSKCLRDVAATQSVVIVLEDCHWIDALSRDLLQALARTSFDLRVVIALAYRPSGKVGGDLGLEALPYFAEIALDALHPDDAARFVRSTLSRIIGTAELPDELVSLIASRAQGNPFYIEQLVGFMHSRGVDLRDPRSLKKLDLPDSLHSLILGRVDIVGEAPRQALKVASVVGRVFSSDVLPGAYPELGSVEEVEKQLQTLLGENLLDLESPGTYAFNHSLTQEVIYESLPFGFRSILHERIAGFIERTQSEAIERQLDLLAHHYWHTENIAKKREYLRRAGVAAQGKYANDAAIEYFERLAPLVGDDARADVLLKLGAVLEVIGDWRRAEDVEDQALALAREMNDVTSVASCETALAEVMRKQGRFDEAVALLERAAAGFESQSEEAGVGKVEHLLGTVAAQRGDYERAVARYERSLAIRERLDDKASMAALLSNLGVIAEYRGDYPRARELHDGALNLRTAIGDRRAIAVSMNNLGMIAVLQKRFEEARQWFERSMMLNREVGDAWMVAICHNNLGNALRGLGNYDAARSHYADSLRAYRNYDDRWAIAFLLEDVGMLSSLIGDARSAFTLMGCADALREAIGTPRSQLLEDELETALATVAENISEGQRSSWRIHGRSLDLQTGIDHALAVCSSDGRTATRETSSARSLNQPNV